MARIPLVLLLAAAILWGGAALWIDGPASRPLAGALALAFAGLSIFLLVGVRGRRRGQIGRAHV